MSQLSGCAVSGYSAKCMSRFLPHTSIVGVTSLLQGGKFGHGFVSAGLTKGVTGNFSYDTSTTFAVLGRTAIAAISGG